MKELIESLREAVGQDDVLVGDAVSDDYGRDECLTVVPIKPEIVVRPQATAQVAAVLRLANEHRVPVTARGSGTGLSGACVPAKNGLVVSFEKMKRVVEIDTENQLAVVEPGVTLAELEEKTREHGLIYPIMPGEASASIGGNVATNAGGMRAVKYGVTRHQVLGLEAVLPNGEVIETGGKFVKTSTGYDLTQLIIGSEGTLAMVTKIIVKLVPRLHAKRTVLAPFEDLSAVTKAVPAMIRSGATPLMIEYMDRLSLMGIMAYSRVELGIEQSIQDKANAYLLIVLEGKTEERVDQDLETIGEVCTSLGALDVFVLPDSAGKQVIAARERGFWAAKQAGVAEIADIVVPRGALSEYMDEVRELSQAEQLMITGTGHAGDGNVHLNLFHSDKEKISAVMQKLFAIGEKYGGVISAEHGIGTAKTSYVSSFEDPSKLALMQRIKTAFDPNGIMNPGKVFA